MSMYLGDFAEDSTVYIPFTTNAADGGRESFSASLEEADLVILKNGAAMTLDASTITFSLDLGSRVGFHVVTVDMSNDADFTTGAEYAAMLYPSDETLDSQAPVGCLATWSCENRYRSILDSLLVDTEATVTDTEATLADTEAATGVLTDTEAILADTEGAITSRATILVDTEAVLADTETGITERATILTDTEAVLSDTETGITERATILTDTEASRVDEAAILADTEAAITARATILTDTEAVLADTEAAGAVITDTEAILADTETGITERATLLTDTEAILSDTEGLAAGSGLTPLASGTAQSGTASTIVLAASAAFADNELNGNIVKITSGTGGGQSRLILSNTNADDTCNITPNWVTTPDATSVYEIVEGAANLVAVGLTTQTAGDIVADTEAILSDSEAVLADTEASQTAETNILADTESALTNQTTIVTDTEAVLTDTESALTNQTTIITDTEAVLTDTEAAGAVLTDTEAILSDSESLVSGVTLADGAHGGASTTITFSALTGVATSSGAVVTLGNFGTGAAISLGSSGTNAVALTSGNVDIATNVVIDGDYTVSGTTDGTLGAIIADLENGGRLDTIFDSTLTDTEAILTDTEAAITARATILTDTEAVLSDTEASQTSETNILADTEAILTDAEAVLADTEAATGVITDTEAILADTEAGATSVEASEIKALIESQRRRHTVQGNVYFVDPVNGDTHANGNRGGPSDPYDSIQDCHDNAVTDSNHDLIYLVSGASGGVTTLTENVTLSKRYLQIRGPGRDFILRASSNTDTVTVTADGIDLEGFRIETTGVGSGKGVQVTSVDFFGCSGCWFANTQGDAINLTDCTNAYIESNNLQNAGQSGSGDGISVVAGSGQTSSYCRILNNFIENTSGDAVVIDTTGGGTIQSTVVQGNSIFNTTETAVNIADSGVADTVVADNRFAGNGFDFQNSSTTASYVNNEDIIDCIWLDTVNGDDGDPGIPSQPVATIARAKTLADDLSKRICVIGGSSFTLAADYSGYDIFGYGYTVALGGQSISAARIEGATVSGIGTGASRPTFKDCVIGTTTLPPTKFDRCGFTDTLTAGSAGAFEFVDCYSDVAGTGAPTFNLNSTDNNNVDITRWARGLTLSGIAANDTITANGDFNTLTLNGSTSATMNVSGMYGTLAGTASSTAVLTNAFRKGDIASLLTDTEASQTAETSILSDTEAVLTDTESSLTNQTTIITDTEAVLSDTEAAITARATILTDTEAILVDSEAILVDTEAIDVSAILTDTEAILADTEVSSDVWATALPGAYGAGTAGYIVGTNLDATVSSVAGNAGSGADTVTLNFKDENSNNIADADVWITSDSAGNVIVAGVLQTNSSGNATFLLDEDSVYYAWLQKDGVNSIRARQFTAVAD